MKAPDDVNYGCGSPTSSFGLTSNSFPEEKQSYSGNCSQVWAYTHNELNLAFLISFHWYVPRAIYCREIYSNEYLFNKRRTRIYLSILL